MSFALDTVQQGRPQDLGGGGGQEFFFQIWEFACCKATNFIDIFIDIY